RRLAQILVDTRSEDEHGQPIAETTSSIIFRGAGGFAGEPPTKEPTPVERPRDTPPTFVVKEANTPEQALLDRLAGDVNPLHTDPDCARSVGFDRGPILHGLATLGFMVRHVAASV